ncbi:MAG: hypothetical protein WCJ29_03345 [bacterium]
MKTGQQEIAFKDAIDEKPLGGEERKKEESGAVREESDADAGQEKANLGLGLTMLEELEKGLARRGLASNISAFSEEKIKEALTSLATYAIQVHGIDDVTADEVWESIGEHNEDGLIAMFIENLAVIIEAWYSLVGVNEVDMLTDERMTANAVLLAEAFYFQLTESGEMSDYGQRFKKPAIAAVTAYVRGQSEAALELLRGQMREIGIEEMSREQEIASRSALKRFFRATELNKIEEGFVYVNATLARTLANSALYPIESCPMLGDLNPPCNKPN